MKYKFKPQTAILVAGVLAAVYAEACYYQGTSAVCVQSGTIVDKITWSNGGTARSVSATADWMVYSQSGYHLVWTGDVAGGYWGYGSDGGGLDRSYCTGPVHFQDAAGNWTSVSSWSRGSADTTFTYSGAIQPSDAGIFAGTADTSSGTCP